MGKVSTILGLGLAGSGLAVGGVFVSGMFSVDSELPDKLDGEEKSFKKSDGGGCVQSLFPGVEKMDGGASPTSNIEGNFFESDKKTYGCLVVNWDKKEKQVNDSDKKWSGNFRFLWSVKAGNKGFVTFAIAKSEPHDTDKKLTWEGVAYTLEYGDNKKWEIKNKLDVATGKTFKSDTDDEGKFPKPANDLEGMKDKSFWGFIESKTDIGKICGQSDCSQEEEMKETQFRAYWSWSGNSTGTKQLSSWTSDLEKWWKEIFGDDKWKMKEVVNAKNGTWIKR